MRSLPKPLLAVAALAGLALVLVGLLAGRHDRCPVIYCVRAPCPQPPCETITASWAWAALGVGAVVLAVLIVALLAGTRRRAV